MKIMNQMPKILMNLGNQPRSQWIITIQKQNKPQVLQNPREIGLSEVWKFVHLLPDDFVLPNTDCFKSKKEEQTNYCLAGVS